MSNSSIRTPMAVLAIMLVAGTSILVAINACKKIDVRNQKNQQPDLSQQFLNIPANSPSVVRRIGEKIRTQNEKDPFIARIAHEAGIPNWEKAVVMIPGPGTVAASGTNEVNGGDGGGIWGTDTLAFIPMGKPGEDWVSSFMACLVGDSNKVAIRLARGDRYPAYGMTRAMDTISAELIALQCMYLEYIASDYKDDLYRVNDLRLFKWDSMRAGNASRFVKFTPEEEPSAAGGNEVNVLLSNTLPCLGVSYMEWQDIMGYAPPPGTPHQQYNPGSYCIDYDLWLNYVLYGNDPGGSIPGDEAGGGGGGDGNDWYNEVVCRVIAGQDPCGGIPSGGGWIVVDTEDENAFNPNVYDSVRISNDILDSFPCVYNLIHDTLFNINQLVQRLMYDNFYLSQYNHIYFQINWAYTCDTPLNGYTKPRGNVTFDPAGNMHWTDTIQLNPCFLKTASKEKIVQVLLHEAVHAYINWCLKEYTRTTPWGQGAVDSNYLVSHFPLHWEAFMGRPYDYSTDHEVMASQYIDYFATLIAAHYNPSAPPMLRDWVSRKLASTGLQFTSAWGHHADLVDTCDIYGVDFWARFHQNSPDYYNYSPPGCGTYNTVFRDSLQMSRGDTCH